MGSTIIKSLSTVKRDDGLWHIKSNSAESNIYPRTFHAWESPWGNEDRNELDGDIINDFYRGCFRGGSRYAAFVKEHSTGVAVCPEWDSYMKVDRLADLAYEKGLKHINDPKDSPEKVRWQKVEARIAKWRKDCFHRLGVAFRRWKPNTEKFVIYVSGDCIVASVGRFGFKYRPSVGYSIVSPKTFSKPAAVEFCKRFTKYSPVMKKVA